MLGLRFCARAFSSCSERGPLFIMVRGPLTITASLVAEHRLQTRRLSSCGSWAQLLCGMWDLPRPGLEPVSPALAGGFSTTAPPGKPPGLILFSVMWSSFIFIVVYSISLSEYITIYLSILLLNFGLLQFGFLANNVAMNILVNVFHCTGMDVSVMKFLQGRITVP